MGEVLAANVGGEWTAETSGGELRLTDPATGGPGAVVAACAHAEVDRAVERAAAAYARGGWAERSARERGSVLQRLAGLVERDADLLARLDSEDAGRPITEVVENDLPGAVESIAWFGEAADKRYGEVSSGSDTELALVTREPVGVAAAVLPWNYPLAMTAWKVGPALAAGNSLLLKPADATPRSALHLARLAEEAGLPEGVLSVLPGTGPDAGAPLAAHDRVGALSFTGSTATGRQILAAAAGSNFKKVSLEMGGKSPQVLWSDALQHGEELVDHLLDAAFLSMGQNCTAGSRILVHRDVLDEVTARFVERAQQLRVGAPSDPQTQVGPLVSRTALDRVTGLVDRAVADGATVLAGGGPHDLASTGGFYFAPTVLTGVEAGSEIEQTEVFGPVVTISGFATEEEAVQRANATPYGLAASLWTTDLDRALRMSRSIRAGVVSVNCYSEGDITVPFGGFGLSGFGGKERSLAAFDQWTLSKTTVIRRR